MLWGTSDVLRGEGVRLEVLLEKVFAPFKEASVRFPLLLLSLSRELARGHEALSRAQSGLAAQYGQGLKNTAQSIANMKSLLESSDPLRQLKLGFSILTKGGRVLRSIEDVQLGEHFEARLSGGTLVAETKEIHK